MLYEIVSGGESAFPFDSLLELAKKVRGRPPPLPDAPPALAAILERALRPDPRQRYPDGEALAGDLDAYLAGDLEQSPGRSVLPFVVGALLVLAILGGLLAAVLVLYGWRG